MLVAVALVMFVVGAGAMLGGYALHRRLPACWRSAGIETGVCGAVGAVRGRRTMTQSIVKRADEGRCPSLDKLVVRRAGQPRWPTAHRAVGRRTRRRAPSL